MISLLFSLRKWDFCIQSSVELRRRGEKSVSFQLQFSTYYFSKFFACCTHLKWLWPLLLSQSQLKRLLLALHNTYIWALLTKTSKQTTTTECRKLSCSLDLTSTPPPLIIIIEPIWFRQKNELRCCDLLGNTQSAHSSRVRYDAATVQRAMTICWCWQWKKGLSNCTFCRPTLYPIHSRR